MLHPGSPAKPCAAHLAKASPHLTQRVSAGIVGGRWSARYLRHGAIRYGRRNSGLGIAGGCHAHALGCGGAPNCGVAHSVGEPSPHVPRHLRSRNAVRVAVANTTGDIRTPGRRGLGDIAWAMAGGFAALGHEVLFISTEPARPAFDSRIRLRELPVWPVFGQGRPGQLQKIVRIWRVLRSVPRVDFVYTPDLMPAGLLARFATFPVVHTPANFVTSKYAHGFPRDRIGAAMQMAEERLAARHCFAINSISTLMEQAWISIGATPDRIVRIPHGVESDHFKPVAGARNRLGLDAADFIVMYAGRLSGEKNLFRLIEAIASLDDPEQHIHLVLLGDGPDQERLEALAEDRRVRATFVPWTPWMDLPWWYGASDVCVLVSTWEPFGRVMAESMACATPFIGAAGTGMGEYLVDGDNGLHCDPRDTASIASAIDRVRRDPDRAREMAERARVYALEAFSWHRVARVLIDYLAGRLGLPPIITDSS